MMSFPFEAKLPLQSRGSDLPVILNGGVIHHVHRPSCVEQRSRSQSLTR